MKPLVLFCQDNSVLADSEPCSDNTPLVQCIKSGPPVLKPVIWEPSNKVIIDAISDVSNNNDVRGALSHQLTGLNNGGIINVPGEDAPNITPPIVAPDDALLRMASWVVEIQNPECFDGSDATSNN